MFVSKANHSLFSFMKNLSLNSFVAIYSINRKFGMELNLAVGNFLWKLPNLIHQLQIQWCLVIQCDP